ncbi:MAG: hypothetical protein GXP23_10340 [Gammaproteobacteria bacterium]|nr:hypothetical protein [Gammaproteobacteria bacterium]
MASQIVLMASDLDKRFAQNISLPPYENLVEVELLDPHPNTRGWFYILITEPEPANKMKSSTRYVHYDSTHDLIETDTNTIGFSSKNPFLADRLQWFLGDDKGFSEDVIDTMKIRHEGKLFHFLPFERTHGDYSSKLVAVKEGPVRIIRRTANKIRIVLGVGSPAVYIDQIIYRNTFVMDIIVDVPFRIGAVFPDLTAVPTIEAWSGQTHP